MATVAETRELTPEDLLAITDRPMPELVDGQIVERETGEELDLIAATILTLLNHFAREHDLGRVHGSQCGYQIFSSQPRKVRIPDVSFTRRERLPAEGPAKGHARIRPDLVVEVVSPNDRAEEVHDRVVDFHGAGVPLIWVVYPSSRTVLVVHADGSARLLGADDAIDGDIVLPGFRCDVRAFFV